MVIISLGCVMILVRYLRFSLIIIRDLRNFLVWVCGAGKERAFVTKFRISSAATEDLKCIL